MNMKEKTKELQEKNFEAGLGIDRRGLDRGNTAGKMTRKDALLNKSGLQETDMFRGRLDHDFEILVEKIAGSGALIQHQRS